MEMIQPDKKVLQTAVSNLSKGVPLYQSTTPLSSIVKSDSFIVAMACYPAIL